MLSKLVHLRSLDASSCTFSTLEHLPLVSKTLEHLSIANCSKLTLESLTVLSQLTGLTSLEMASLRNRAPFTLETSARLQGLSRLSNLRQLNLSRFSHPQGMPRGLLKGISGMAALRELHLANCSKEAEDSTRSHEAVASAETSSTSSPLSLGGSDQELWFLEGLVQLQVLDLSGWRHAKAAALRGLSGLTALTHLKLQR